MFHEKSSEGLPQICVYIRILTVCMNITINMGIYYIYIYEWKQREGECVCVSRPACTTRTNIQISTSICLNECTQTHSDNVLQTVAIGIGIKNNTYIN